MKKTVNLQTIPDVVTEADSERNAFHAQEMIGDVPFWDFIEQTRRVHELTTNRKPRTHYARGLDSRREDFA